VARRVRESDKDVLEGGGTRTFEEHFESDGKVRTYLTTKGVYKDETGRTIGLFGTYRFGFGFSGSHADDGGFETRYHLPTANGKLERIAIAGRIKHGTVIQLARIVNQHVIALFGLSHEYILAMSLTAVSLQLRDSQI
jgi:hypothetical protein